MDQADHLGLRTWAQGTAALLAEWSSHPEKAVEIASAGMAAATGVGRTRLAAIHARAAARAGDLSRHAPQLRSLRTTPSTTSRANSTSWAGC